MTIHFIPCGPPANESEEKSFDYLKRRLISEASDQEWILLANLALSITQNFKSDEIDLIAIGPGGVKVIEIKHWSGDWISRNQQKVEDEAERLNAKARKVATTLRRKVPDLPFVKGEFLLSQDFSRVKKVVGKDYRGATLYHLNQWKDLIGFDQPHVLSPPQIASIANALEPRSKVAIDGSLRRLAGYINLELQSPKEDRFHRVYKGKNPASQDRVILHLYDLSADDSPKAEKRARRAFEAIRRLQLYYWAPRILDSFQEVPGYPGEMYFYTLIDPEAPTVEDRREDATWDTRSRIAFAKASLSALKKLHEADSDHPLVHRNLTPKTLLVRYDNTPIFTGFEYTRIPTEVSIASSSFPDQLDLAFMAPEVLKSGLAVANPRSDIYSLCATLNTLFDGRGDDMSEQARTALSKGMRERPEDRASLEELGRDFSVLLGESIPAPPPPPARFWTEGQEVKFRGDLYQIVAKLGSGGMGMAFKVIQLDRHTKEELGTYVAKVALDEVKGRQMLRAYTLVRSHLGYGGLSTVFEVAKEWRENEFVALMKWVPGSSLMDYSGVFALLAEDQQASSGEALAFRWLRESGQALSILHRNGLIHGDVSPRNLIVSGSSLVLTDYDFVQKIGEDRSGPGTMLYAAPSDKASPSDDIFALAASFFHVLFDIEPFDPVDLYRKSKGLQWDQVDDDDYDRLRPFFDKATHPDPSQRFSSVEEVFDFLDVLEASETSEKEDQQPIEEITEEQEAIGEQVPDSDELESAGDATGGAEASPAMLKEQRVPWLKFVLQSYPGSRWGNQETRGLDSYFATETYVETALEHTLIQDIQERRVRLVVLCGNAGDGKTALLQHLAEQLGLKRPHSSQRVLERELPDGPLVRMNLDGSASWKGRSSDEILNDFLRPFMDGQPEEDIFHLLAINDGRLLEWIETAEREFGSKPLFDALRQMLDRKVRVRSSRPGHDYIRFINMNERSLVGGIDATANDGQGNIDTTFLHGLIDQLYGGDQAASTWTPCLTCTAQERCEVYKAARIFGPESMPEKADPEVRRRARERLFETLQAVHVRGETHITIRELRAALVYILFGVNYCDDYHNGDQAIFLPYWDRAFLADSPARQGEVLSELIRFDPGLEAHPRIDRHLYNQWLASEAQDLTPLEYNRRLASARRRAYFEWSKRQIEEIAQQPHALGLANGRHLQEFLHLPFASEEEQLRLTKRLCAGISRLEDLPAQALEREGVVPLRIIPRTPTETAFWVEKPLARFQLEADLFPKTEGIEQLHRQASLTYTFENGQKERLRMGYDLFHLLLELADGYQLGDVSSEDTFTRLAIFVQRLVKEDERTLLAWTPVQDERIYQITAEMAQTSDGPRQTMVITPLDAGE